MSLIQRPVTIHRLACADLHNPALPNGRFEDNDVYIGHDEPGLNFISSAPGSGNNVTWTFTLPTDPTALPTVATPGQDVTHTFELTPALWFSMQLCDPNSYPQTPCIPNRDDNAPSAECLNTFPCLGNGGAGSTFMEMQFYPPGFAPAVSVDSTHWGAALTIDSLEATPNFAFINPDCAEPQNFAFIQRNGVPTGPPSPQLGNLASNIPNAETLLLNPGDTIRLHMFDARTAGRGRAFEAAVTDLTTGQRGFMQASAANGFMNTNVETCNGTPFNFEPEYSTAAATNISPWAASTQVIGASFETGHFTPCTSLGDEALMQFGADLFAPAWSHCVGPYEETAPDGDGPDTVEPSDGPCFPAGDNLGLLSLNSSTQVTGCVDDATQNGDLDFDGSPYWADWPNSTTPNTFPASFQIKPPTTGDGSQYTAFQFQTDLAFSELTTCSSETPGGCTAPPPDAPGHFYPYWTLASAPGTGGGTTCSFEFGNMQNGNTFGGTAQYGGFNQTEPIDFPSLASDFHANTCSGAAPAP